MFSFPWQVKTFCIYSQSISMFNFDPLLHKPIPRKLRHGGVHAFDNTDTDACQWDKMPCPLNFFMETQKNHPFQSVGRARGERRDSRNPLARVIPPVGSGGKKVPIFFRYFFGFAEEGGPGRCFRGPRGPPRAHFRLSREKKDSGEQKRAEIF